MTEENRLLKLLEDKIKENGELYGSYSNMLERVKKEGDELQFVKNQTPEICLAAVKQNGYALKYVRNQTREICLAALKEDEGAIKYVRLHGTLKPKIEMSNNRLESIIISFADGTIPEGTTITFGENHD